MDFVDFPLKIHSFMPHNILNISVSNTTKQLLKLENLESSLIFPFSLSSLLPHF